MTRARSRAGSVTSSPTQAVCWSPPWSTRPISSDRDGAPDVLAQVRSGFPWLRHVFADGGYASDKLRQAMAGHGDWTIGIIKRSDTAKGFVLLPRRWVVERTFAWLGRNRPMAKDFETTLESSTAWLMMESVQLMTRRLANP